VATFAVDEYIGLRHQTGEAIDSNSTAPDTLG